VSWTAGCDILGAVAMRVLLIDFNPFAEAVTPISIGYLAAALRKSGHQAEVLGLGSTSRFSVAGLRAYLDELGPGLVGFAAYQRNMHAISGIAGLVKEHTDAATVIGGPQATFLPEEALSSLPMIDFVSRGEGEQTIVDLAAALESGAPSGGIAGITSRAPDGTAITTAKRPHAKHLDDYPSPWLDGVLDPAAMPECILLTSRGCPYNCAFCYTPAAFDRTIRYHSHDRVLEEISWIAKRGTGRLWFADPNFSFSAKRVTGILEAILHRGLSVQMWLETRADMIGPELLSLMKRAGVHTLAMGLESASAEVMPGLDKGLELAQIRHAVGLAFDHGIDVELFSQFGLPHESFADAMQTLDFVKSCGVAIRGNSNAQQMQLYFGSEICARYSDYGVIPLRDHFPAWQSIGAAFETQWMTATEIEGAKAAWRSESLDGGKRLVS